MKKASDIKLVSLYSTIKMMHGPINIRFLYLVQVRLKYVELKSKWKENRDLTGLEVSLFPRGIFNN
jgi:hypothetical protein